MFPHPTSCSKFYECANGQIFTKDCAPGTLYNPLIKACDFPDKSGCKLNANGEVEFEWKEEVITETGHTSGGQVQYVPVSVPSSSTKKTIKTIKTKTMSAGKLVCLGKLYLDKNTFETNYFFLQRKAYSPTQLPVLNTMCAPTVNFKSKTAHFLELFTIH